MKAREAWAPTKAELHRGRWRGSRNRRHLAVHSRAIADWTIAAYERELRAHAHGILADVGCGNVPYFGIYRDLVDDVITIDWATGIHQKQHVDIECDLNRSIALADGSVDSVLCTDMMQYIIEPRLLWSEMFRIARPGAAVIIGVPFYYWITERPHDYHRYTRYALERYARESGFEVASIYPVGGLPHVFVDLTCKATRRLRWLSAALSALGQAVLAIPPIGRAALRSGDLLPLAYVMVAKRPQGEAKSDVSSA